MASYETEVELISSYNDWAAQRKREAADITPSAFLADRMKQEALDRIIAALDEIDKFGEWDEITGTYIQLTTESDIRLIEGILRGGV